MNSASQSEASSETAGARKLIAIVHADIVGYSRHINRDDAGTLDRVRMIRRDLIDPELRKHGGRLVNTAGDALLIEFASITAAVQCAVEVQRRVREFDGDLPPSERIRFRIGINIGDVLPEGTDIHGGVGAMMPQPDQMLSVTKAFQTPILASSLGQLATSFGGFFATCTAMYLPASRAECLLSVRSRDLRWDAGKEREAP